MGWSLEVRAGNCYFQFLGVLPLLICGVVVGSTGGRLLFSILTCTSNIHHIMIQNKTAPTTVNAVLLSRNFSTIPSNQILFIKPPWSFLIRLCRCLCFRCLCRCLCLRFCRCHILCCWLWLFLLSSFRCLCLRLSCCKIFIF